MQIRTKKEKNSQQMSIREKQTDDGASCAKGHQNQKSPMFFKTKSLQQQYFLHLYNKCNFLESNDTVNTIE